MAVFMVEFSYGLAPPFIKLSVGKRWGQPPRDLGASREGAQSGLRTCSELASERYKKQRSERSELGSERYKEPSVAPLSWRGADLELASGKEAACNPTSTGTGTCLMQKNKLTAIRQYLWSGFRTASPCRSWSSRRASLNAITRGLRTSPNAVTRDQSASSELGSERYKKAA